eukprot:TRINITY_DN15205_c0_g2_i1.p1 TRINITY_DN15205_c0_g2~~TRINITY_DN15205_c0_g2_i1.p1  ORF type:complete len:410 (+),score=64.34 TRINITY_DN15205_c0_g2_i1:465-1694(+)
MWGAFTLQKYDGKLIQILIPQIKQQMNQLSGKQIECIFWVFSQSQFYEENLFSELGNQSAFLMQSNRLKIKDIFIISEQFMNLRFYSEHFLEQLAINTFPFADQINNLQLSQISKFLVDMGHGEKNSVKQFMKVIRERNQEQKLMNIKCVVNFLWCFSMLGGVQGEEWYNLVQECQRHLNLNLPLEIRQKIHFSMLVSHHVYNDAILKTALSDEQWLNLIDLQNTNNFQSQFSIKKSNQEELQNSTFLNDEIQQENSQLQKTEQNIDQLLFQQNSKNDEQNFDQFKQSQDSRNQQFLDEVEEVLNQIEKFSDDKFQFLKDFLVSRDGIKAHFCLSTETDRNVAVQCVFDDQFSCNTPYIKFVEPILQRHLLESQNLKVLEVPFFEWKSLENIEEKIHYIKDNLKFLDQH